MSKPILDWPTKLRALADWIDLKYPNDSDPEIQKDLRELADQLADTSVDVERVFDQCDTQIWCCPQCGDTGRGLCRRCNVQSELHSAFTKSELTRALSCKEKVCVWKRDPDDSTVWIMGCGQEICFDEEPDFKFTKFYCCCGGKIEVKE